MYVIEKWNGEYDDDYQVKIVAGFPTLEEASAWCYNQQPTRSRYGKEQAIPTKEAFIIQRVEGETVTLIPHPWESQ